MPITIGTSEEEYDSVDWLISELVRSETAGFQQVRDLLEPLPGFSDEGLTDAERAGNYVRVFHYATFTDLLAADTPVRLHPVTLASRPPARQSQPKFAVHYRDVFCMRRIVHVFAESGDDAARCIMEDGYGYADGHTLFPRKIECVEPVPLQSVRN